MPKSKHAQPMFNDLDEWKKIVASVLVAKQATNKYYQEHKAVLFPYTEDDTSVNREYMTLRITQTNLERKQHHIEQKFTWVPKSDGSQVSLLDRQFEIFEKVLQGVTLKELGEEYGLTPERIRTIFQKQRRILLHPFTPKDDIETDSLMARDMKTLRESKDLWLKVFDRYKGLVLDNIKMAVKEVTGQ